MQLLPGFRDFYPADCARRDYILAKWREVARRYGFVEYDGPVLETLDLYKKKSGGEIVGQLFEFADKGDRNVALRPEMTPTLARLVAARERDFKKPLKWFCAPQFFRYEKPQRGRGREFYQFNADIIGEASPAADGELIALAIDTLRAFGFTETDFVVRISNRDEWGAFLATHGKSEQLENFLGIIDKVDRTAPEAVNRQLEPFGMTLADVHAEFEKPVSEWVTAAEFLGGLRARGLEKFVEFDLRIVRGLAYYTGFVFEVFDRSKSERALAGGGRYDNLLSVISDGKVNLPALGFGMGDYVLSNLIGDVPRAQEKREAWLAANRAIDVYAVIAKEECRAEALGVVQQLREAGLRIDFPLTPLKVGKQFQAASQLGASMAVVFGDEWPTVKIKDLATREERGVPVSSLLHELRMEPVPA